MSIAESGGFKRILPSDFSRQSRIRGPRGAISMEWLEEGLLVLAEQQLALINAGEKDLSLSLECQKPRLASLPGKKEALLLCHGDRSQLIRVDTLQMQPISEPISLVGERKTGAFAVEPAGRWAVLPAQARQKEGMCLFNLQSGNEGPCFAPEPLRQVRFSKDGATLLGIDRRGRAWKWTVLDLF